MIREIHGDHAPSYQKGKINYLHLPKYIQINPQMPDSTTIKNKHWEIFIHFYIFPLNLSGSLSSLQLLLSPGVNPLSYFRNWLHH